MRVTRLCVRSRSGLVALPEDLLLIILGHLPLPSLLAVRLVCRLLRIVSSFATTSLDLTPHRHSASFPRFAVRKLKSLPNLSKRRLKLQQGLTKLCFSGDEIELEAVLRDCPNCTSMLREICLDFRRAFNTAAHPLSAFATIATQLTALTRMRCWAEDEELPIVIASCPRQLARLDLPDYHACHALPGLPESIQKLTALQTLRLSHMSSKHWEDLLPRLTSLPHLKDLAEVHVHHEAVAVSIAAITSLTRLDILPSVRSLDALMELSALEALQVRLSNSWGKQRMTFECLPHGMSQLRKLAVLDECGFTGFDLLAESLGRLVNLHLHTDNACTVCTLLKAPLQRLRHLSVNLGEGSPSEFHALGSALAGLQSLSISVHHTSVREVFQHLPQLTRLTSLWIEAAVLNMEPVPATFLNSLTWLAELKLFMVLSKDNPQSDISCLATLTRLQCLVLMSGGTERRPAKRAPVEPLPPVVRPKDLHPLSALRWLEVWDVNHAWDTSRACTKKLNEVVRLLCPYPAYSKHDLNSNKSWRYWRFGHRMSNLQEL